MRTLRPCVRVDGNNTDCRPAWHTMSALQRGCRMSVWTGTLMLADDGSLTGGISDVFGWEIHLIGISDTDPRGVRRWRIHGDVVIPILYRLPWETDGDEPP